MDRPRAFVIGPGEVGTRLGRALDASGWHLRYVSRTRGWEEALRARGPVRILAMREDDLPPALERFPEDERRHLVLVQNGFLEAGLGDLGDVTRALVWFTSKGDFFRVLMPSLLHGPHAGPLASGLEQGGVPARRIEDRDQFLREMIIKGAWNCVVGLPLAVHGVDLAGYLGGFREEMEAVVRETVEAAGAEYGVAVSGVEAVGRLLETTGALGWVRGGTKALSWRNGAVRLFGRRHDVPTPVNDRLLEAAGAGS